MNKTACITGATAGFGEAIARACAKRGWRLVVTGRRQERLVKLQQELGSENVHTLCFDVRDKKAVQQAVESIPPEFAAIDLLVNNAGLALGLEPAYEGGLDDWEVMVDTNIKGLMYMTRAVLPGMVRRGRGHVVNLGSIAGSYAYPGGNVYGATKAFVKQFSRGLRADLPGKGVRVTNIEPGLAESEFSLVRFKGDTQKAASLYDKVEPLTPRDVAQAVLWAVEAPAHVNVDTIELMPVCQSFGPLHICR